MMSNSIYIAFEQLAVKAAELLWTVCNTIEGDWSRGRGMVPAMAGAGVMEGGGRPWVMLYEEEKKSGTLGEGWTMGPMGQKEEAHDFYAMIADICRDEYEEKWFEEETKKAYAKEWRYRKRRGKDDANIMEEIYEACIDYYRGMGDLESCRKVMAKKIMLKQAQQRADIDKGMAMEYEEKNGIGAQEIKERRGDFEEMMKKETEKMRKPKKAKTTVARRMEHAVLNALKEEDVWRMVKDTKGEALPEAQQEFVVRLTMAVFVSPKDYPITLEGYSNRQPYLNLTAAFGREMSGYMEDKNRKDIRTYMGTIVKKNDREDYSEGSFKKTTKQAVAWMRAFAEQMEQEAMDGGGEE